MNIAASVGKRIVATAVDSTADNPVLAMGFRTRMRKATGFLVMGAYVLLLALVLLIAWYSLWDYSYARTGIANRNIGMNLFHVLNVTQAILFLLIVPSLTSGALTQEIERRTVELLALTPLTPGRIVMGKHLSAFLYCMALLISSLPLAGICLMLGGLSPAEIAVSYLLLSAWVFFLASVGVFWSSLANATPVSTLFTYGSCIVYQMLISSVTAATMYRGGHTGFAGGGDAFVLAGLDSTAAASRAMMSAKVCGLSISVALVAFVMQVAVGLLLLFAAMTRVRYHRTEKALPIRALLLGITAALIWLLIGNLLMTIAAAGADALSVLEFTSGFMLVLMGLATSVFVTGELKMGKNNSVFAYALSGRKMFRNDLGGGISFILLWFGVAYGVLGLTIWWTYVANGATLVATFWPIYLKTGVAALAILAGLSAMGVLFSSIMRLRPNAVALTVFFAILAFSGALIVLIFYFWGPYAASGIHKAHSDTCHLVIFWPMTPILAIQSWTQDYPKLWWAPRHFWIASVIIYLSLAAGALALASPAYRKWGGVKEE